MSTPEKTKILAVSFTFPPLNYPRSVQVARLLKHINASTVLLCADDEESLLDPTMEPDAEAGLARCIRVPARRAGWAKLADLGAQKMRLPVWSKSPDQHRAWKRAVLRRAADFLAEGRFDPDLIVTFGHPMTDHLIGLELSRRLRRPWIAHFSDPWVDNPLNRYDRLTKAVNLSLERRVFGAAGKLLFTSQETVDLVMSKYPAAWLGRAAVLPHCFDPAQYAKAAGDGGPGLTLRYLGNFYGRRTPRPLFGALARIHAIRPSILDGVCFELIGVMDRDDAIRDTGFENLPAGLVRVETLVSYRRSLELMASADGLLVLDAPAAESVFLPSKLIDYVGAGRPILGLTPPGAASALIGQLGGESADPGDEAAMAESLEVFIGQLRRGPGGGDAPWGEPGVRQRYEASRVAQVFDGLVREALA